MSRKKKKPIEWQSYLFEILEWDFKYAISLNQGFYPVGPYSEYSSINIQTKAKFPKQLTGEVFKFTLLGSRMMDENLKKPEQSNFEPLCVGSLKRRADQKNYLGSVPHSGLGTLVFLLEKKQIKWLSLHGHKIKYGSAKITFFDFLKNYDPEDFYE